MLRPEEIRDLARRQPFRPFRIHLSDQTHFDVIHPEMIMVGVRSVTVGIPGRRPGIAARTLTLDLSRITRIDPDLTQASPA